MLHTGPACFVEWLIYHPGTRAEKAAFDLYVLILLGWGDSTSFLSASVPGVGFMQLRLGQKYLSELKDAVA